MTFTVEDNSRVGRSTYWMYYIGITVTTWAMYAWAIYEVLKLETIPIVFGLIAPTILSIWFRVIAMRRCRDIGWPAFLPWLTIGLIVVCSIFSGMQAGFHPEAALATMGVTMILSGLLGFADFVFLIVIGCLDSAGGGYADAFAGGPYEPEDLPDSPHGYVDVMGRSAAPARPARPLPKSYGEEEAPVAAAPQPALAPAVRGFGRRVV